MKKIVSILMALALLIPAFALAEGTGVSPTTGLPTDKVYKPVTLQMDNEGPARPQFGLISADVVYEIELYNGGYTRYTAVFNDVIPDYVEAIRSARISNVDLALNFGGLFVHYGGQNYPGRDVFAYEKGVSNLATINGQSYKNFKRDGKRVAPYNVYANLQDVQNIKEYTAEPKSPLTFSADQPSIKGDDAAKFEIIYRKDYHPSYEYNADEGRYYRFYNGNPHKDGASGEQLTCANVIIMNVATSWHQNMSDAPVHDLTGEGSCRYFIGGKTFTGKWTRASVNDATTYLDDEGNVVAFVPGKTFIQVVKDKFEVNILP